MLIDVIRILITLIDRASATVCLSVCPPGKHTYIHPGTLSIKSLPQVIPFCPPHSLRLVLKEAAIVLLTLLLRIRRIYKSVNWN